MIYALLMILEKIGTLFYRARKNLPPIKHSFDVWHFIKAILKDLYTAGKLKRCATLGLWQRSIKHQLWHCLANCNWNPELLAPCSPSPNISATCIPSQESVIYYQFVVVGWCVWYRKRRDDIPILLRLHTSTD